MKSKKEITRMAGFLYLVVALVGPFGLMYVPTALIFPGNAATKAREPPGERCVRRPGHPTA